MRPLHVGPRLRFGKKCDTWAKDTESDRTLTLQIPTMQILISQILCVGKIGAARRPVAQGRLGAAPLAEAKGWLGHAEMSPRLAPPGLAVTRRALPSVLSAGAGSQQGACPGRGISLLHGRAPRCQDPYTPPPGTGREAASRHHQMMAAF